MGDIFFFKVGNDFSRTSDIHSIHPWIKVVQEVCDYLSFGCVDVDDDEDDDEDVDEDEDEDEDEDVDEDVVEDEDEDEDEDVDEGVDENVEEDKDSNSSYGYFDDD